MSQPSLKPPAFESKVCSMDSSTLNQRLLALNRPMVFTNGVFDILHRGHASYLAQARDFGASLVVGVNSDASVKLLGKGDDRPINSQEEWEKHPDYEKINEPIAIRKPKRINKLRYKFFP